MAIAAAPSGRRAGPAAAARRECRGLVMGVTGTGDGLCTSYIHDDRRRREEFDRELAGYVRRFGERWDLTALVEPLELAGRRVRKVEVEIERRPGGALSVALRYELPPGRA